LSVAEGLLESPQSQLRQGDIFEAVPFTRAGLVGENANPLSITGSSYRAILLNQSCEIDKSSTKRLILLPVVPLVVLSAGDQTNVKKNKVFSRLHLPSFGDVLPETFVQFMEPMTVEKDCVEKLARIASLTETGRRALYVQYTRWVTRWMLTELSCPSCGTSFNPSETLFVENT
jgi:hypothetical protein